MFSQKSADDFCQTALPVVGKSHFVLPLPSPMSKKEAYAS